MNRTNTVGYRSEFGCEDRSMAQPDTKLHNWLQNKTNEAYRKSKWIKQKQDSWLQQLHIENEVQPALHAAFEVRADLSWHMDSHPVTLARNMMLESSPVRWSRAFDSIHTVATKHSSGWARLGASLSME